MKESRTRLKTYFQTGDQPTEQEFVNWFDSTLNLSGSNSITGSLLISGARVDNADGSPVDFYVMGDITCSGNISASGTIYADNFQSTGGDLAGINFTDHISLTGNMTASGDISASGDIRSQNAYINDAVYFGNGVSDFIDSQISASADTLTLSDRSNIRNWIDKNDAGGAGSFTVQAHSTKQTRFLVSSSGNVGIGVSSPTQRLDVRSNAIIAGATPAAPIGSNAQLEIYHSGSDATLAIHQDDSTATSKFSQLRFRNGGNDTYLKVPTSANGLVIDVESKANAFRITTDGDVNISGSVSASGDGSFANINIGGHITASGNISASGIVFASKFESAGTAGETISFNDNINLTGHLTASGDISSSGTVKGLTGSFGRISAGTIGTIDGSSTTIFNVQTLGTLDLEADTDNNNAGVLDTVRFNIGGSEIARISGSIASSLPMF